MPPGRPRRLLIDARGRVARSYTTPIRLSTAQTTARRAPAPHDGAGAQASASVQWLHLDQGGAMVAPDPERDRRRRIVDEHGAHVGFARQQVLDRLAGLGIEPDGAVGMHAAGPYLAVLVHGGAIRIGVRRQRPLRQLLG